MNDDDFRVEGHGWKWTLFGIACGILCALAVVFNIL